MPGDCPRGEATTVELLYGPPKAIKTLTRMDQRTFKLLLDRLVNEYKLRPQEYISAEQKLMIFIAIYRGGWVGVLTFNSYN